MFRIIDTNEFYFSKNEQITRETISNNNEIVSYNDNRNIEDELNPDTYNINLEIKNPSIEIRFRSIYLLNIRNLLRFNFFNVYYMAEFIDPTKNIVKRRFYDDYKKLLEDKDKIVMFLKNIPVIEYIFSIIIGSKKSRRDNINQIFTFCGSNVINSGIVDDYKIIIDNKDVLTYKNDKYLLD